MNKNEAMVELCELNMRVFDYYHKYHKNVRTLTSIQINILIKDAHFWPLEWESTLPKRLIYQP